MNVSPLALRVLDAVHAASYEMVALLSLVGIEESDEVPTAEVSCARRPLLRINPRFVAAHCATDEHLFVLVMHELHHVLLGHTRLFRRVTPAQNVAFDAVINALLCERFPWPKQVSFFHGLYANARGPLRLLAPPGPGRTIRDTRLRRLHKRLYRKPEDVSAREVYDEIVNAVGFVALPGDGPPLLGSHGGADEREGDSRRVADFVGEALGDVSAGWPDPFRWEPCRRGLTGELRQLLVRPEPPVDPVLATVRRALDATARARSPRGRGACPRPATAPVPALLPTPTRHDRRAAVLLASGVPPLLHLGSLADRRRRNEATARVYLDVSESTVPFLPGLYRALWALRDRLEPEVRLFSTVVQKVPRAALATGLRPTTGGTDIGCVLADALAGRSSRLLVITDGEVGRPPDELARRVRNAGLEVRVLLTPGGLRADVEGLAARIDELPPARLG